MLSVPQQLDVHLHHGQLRNSQNEVDSELAGQTLPLPRPLHAHLGQLVELVERWFALLTERQLRRGVHRSTKELKAAIDDFMKTTQPRPKTIHLA